MEEKRRLFQQSIPEAIHAERENISRAQELRISAQQAADELFQGGNIQSFLNLVSRLHYYDAYNLLLIYLQFPKATCLAGQKLWKSLLDDPDAKVLKEIWRKGKGIELIVPYKEYRKENSYSLTWSAVMQYDISQTNVTNYQPAPSVYIQDAGHSRFLLESLVCVISTEHHRSVIRVASSSQLRRAGLVGQMNDVTILLRDDTKPTHRIQFLCECLCQLAVDPSSGFSMQQMDLFRQYIIYCLFRIWGLTPERPLQQQSAILSSISTDLHMSFLTLIHQTVRRLDNSISAAYRYIRAGGCDADTVLSH